MGEPRPRPALDPSSPGQPCWPPVSKPRSCHIPSPASEGAQLAREKQGLPRPQQAGQQQNSDLNRDKGSPRVLPRCLICPRDPRSPPLDPCSCSACFKLCPELSAPRPDPGHGLCYTCHLGIQIRMF